MPAKIICFALCISTLLLGCMSTASITSEQPGFVEKKVVFHLADSSIVRSEPGQHQRIDGGYKVTGLHTKGDWILDDFEGVIHDADLREVTVTELDTGRTVMAAVAVVGAIAIVVGMVELARGFEGWGRGSSKTIDLEFPN